MLTIYMEVGKTNIKSVMVTYSGLNRVTIMRKWLVKRENMDWRGVRIS